MSRVAVRVFSHTFFSTCQFVFIYKYHTIVFIQMSNVKNIIKLSHNKTVVKDYIVYSKYTYCSLNGSVKFIQYCTIITPALLLICTCGL
jgi:hypothetical protein